MTVHHNTIAHRKIGGLEVSALGLGCMGMSFAYGPADQDEATATLHHALDQGVNLLDTADMYGGGDNERLLAGVLKDRPDEVVLATNSASSPIRRPVFPTARTDHRSICARPSTIPCSALVSM